MRVDARVGVVWLIASLVAVLLTASPLASIMLVIGASVAASAGEQRSSFKGFLLFGAIALVIRTTLFALTGHEGEKILITLPSITLPIPGGLTVGGPVVEEVVRQSLAEGLRLVSVIAIFGAFVSLVRPIDLLRLVPDRFFDAGLILNIAISTAPNMVRTAKSIREAQRMRGCKSRATILTPLIATAVERSIDLAETMDSRGYASGTRSRLKPRPLQTTDLLILAAAVACGGSAVWVGRADDNQLVWQLFFWLPSLLLAAPALVLWRQQ